MIAIGVNYGGPEQRGSGIYKLLNATMKALIDVRGPWIGGDDFEPSKPQPAIGPYFEVGATPAVNLIFYVPGSILSYSDLKEIEASRFSRKKKLLMVAVPVPDDVVATGGSIDFIIDALHKSNAIAVDVFAKKGTEPFDLDKAEAIVQKVKDAMLVQGF